MTAAVGDVRSQAPHGSEGLHSEEEQQQPQQQHQHQIGAARQLGALALHVLNSSGLWPP